MKGDAPGGPVHQHRSIRLAQRQKNGSRRTSRSYLTQVFQNRISHLCSQWKFLSSLGLRAAHTDLFVGPVQVLQCQATDLPDAHPVYRQEQNDCTVTNVSRPFCIEIGHQALNLLPSWTLWQSDH